MITVQSSAITKLVFFTLLSTAIVYAGDTLSKFNAKQFVSVGPIAPVNVGKGKPVRAQIKFHVQDGYHINSNQPGSELLIPTIIKLDSPTQVSIGKIEYPTGHDFALPIAPTEKLNVYSGDVLLTMLVSAGKKSAAGSYSVKGELKYQACNDNSCFPPKTLPVEFTVNIQ